MKALIYARQSSGKDDLSESVEAQIKNCKQLADKEKLEVVGIFRDLNTSGETYPVGAEEIAYVDKAYQEWIANQSSKKNYRTGLGEALLFLDNVDFILVNELTRLYRPINGSFLEGHINHLLREKQIKVLQVQGGSIDLAKFDQQLITMIKNQILYDDLQKKRQNSINAFRIKRDSGKLCCGTHAFGLKYLGNDQIEVKPEWIGIIKYIFDSISQYKAYSAIVRECNARWKNECYFYESSIYRIARQPLYAGYQYNSAGELIKNVQLTGQEFISFEQWQEVQKIIGTKRREHHARAKKHWLPLSGKLYCGECGSKLICTIDHGKIYYTCHKKNIDRDHRRCKNSRIRFEPGVYGKSSLYDAIFPLLSIALIEKHRKASEMLKGKKEISKYEVELENMKIKERTLFDMFAEGLASEIQLRNMLANHKKKSMELMRKIAAIRASDISEDKVEELKYSVLTHMFNELSTKSLPNELYESLLNEAEIYATVYRDRVDFQTKYGPVSVPRVKIKTRFWMPEWEIELKNASNQNAASIDDSSRIVATYLTGKKTKLADFGNLKIISK